MEHRKINNEKMQHVADEVKAHLPGCGFAVIAFDLEEGAACGSYVSNVQDDFMIKMLEHQLEALKGKSSLASVIPTSKAVG